MKKGDYSCLLFLRDMKLNLQRHEIIQLDLDLRKISIYSAVLTLYSSVWNMGFLRNTFRLSHLHAWGHKTHWVGRPRVQRMGRHVREKVNALDITRPNNEWWIREIHLRIDIGPEGCPDVALISFPDRIVWHIYIQMTQKQHTQYSPVMLWHHALIVTTDS